MRVRQGYAGFLADIGEGFVAIVTVEEIRMTCHLGYIEVHVAVAVVVEDDHTGAVVPDTVAIFEGSAGDIHEGNDGIWVMHLVRSYSCRLIANAKIRNAATNRSCHRCQND